MHYYRWSGKKRVINRSTRLKRMKINTELFTAMNTERLIQNFERVALRSGTDHNKTNLELGPN